MCRKECGERTGVGASPKRELLFNHRQLSQRLCHVFRLDAVLAGGQRKRRASYTHAGLHQSYEIGNVDVVAGAWVRCCGGVGERVVESFSRSRRYCFPARLPRHGFPRLPLYVFPARGCFSRHARLPRDAVMRPCAHRIAGRPPVCRKTSCNDPPAGLTPPCGGAYLTMCAKLRPTFTVSTTCHNTKPTSGFLKFRQLWFQEVLRQQSSNK